MQKYWYNKKNDYIARLEATRRKRSDWNIGLVVTDEGPGSYFNTTIELHLFFWSIWFSLQLPVFRRKKKDYEGYEWGVRFYRMSEPTGEILTWMWMSNTNEWSSKTPWYRYKYVSIRDALFGSWKSSDRVLSQCDDEWVDSMDSKVYPCRITVSRYDQYRSRMRFLRRYFHRIELDLDFEEKGIGAPIPGKGENSWDCDDTTTRSTSFGMGDDPLPEDPVAWAKVKFTEGIERTRQEYGGKCWRPAAA